MSLLKTGACFTAELELNCPTIVACVAALPVGAPAVAGDLVLGPDNMYHALPAAPAPVPQTISLTGQTLTLSNGGGSVVIPDLDTQDISISGNVISLTNGGSVTLPTTAAPVPQVLSIAGNTVSLSGGGGSVTVPDSDDQTLSLVGNVLTISEGNSVTLPVAATPFATPAQTIAGTSTTLAVNPADLYARENIPAQTGLSNDITAIAAPAANQSPWGINALGETLHYAPGIGWQIVDNLWAANCTDAAAVALVANTSGAGCSITIPRDGLYTVAAFVNTVSGVTAPQTGGIMINGVLRAYGNTGASGAQGGTNISHAPLDNNASASWNGRLVAGDVVSTFGLILTTSGSFTGHLEIASLGQ